MADIPKVTLSSDFNHEVTAAELMLQLGWTVRPPLYRPGTGEYVSRRWVHDDYTNELELSPHQYRWCYAHQIAGVRHDGGWLWEGEHENNGPSWCALDCEGLHLSTREIYEVIDPTLPYKDRFRTLRYELIVSLQREPDDYKRLAVQALSSREWLELGQTALNTGLTAQERGV